MKQLEGRQSTPHFFFFYFVNAPSLSTLMASSLICFLWHNKFSMVLFVLISVGGVLRAWFGSSFHLLHFLFHLLLIMHVCYIFWNHLTVFEGYILLLAKIFFAFLHFSLGIFQWPVFTLTGASSTIFSLLLSPSPVFFIYVAVLKTWNFFFFNPFL